MAASSEAGVLERPAIKEKKPKSASAPKHKAREGSRKRRPADPNARTPQPALGRGRGGGRAVPPAQRLAPSFERTGPVSPGGRYHRHQRRSARVRRGEDAPQCRQGAAQRGGHPGQARSTERIALPTSKTISSGEAVVRLRCGMCYRVLSDDCLHPAPSGRLFGGLSRGAGSMRRHGGDGLRCGSGAGAGRGGRFRRPAGHGHRWHAGCGPSRRRGAGARALRAAGFSMPGEKIVVNLAPSHLRKTGSGFDLP